MNATAFSRFILNQKLLFCLLVLVAVGISMQQFNVQHIGNEAIFKISFYNLINHRDLYLGSEKFDGQALDLFKYSPTFALLYAPIAVLPMPESMIAWNILNVILFFFAIRSLPFDDKKKSIVLWLCVLEIVTCAQNSQSNTLMAALLIFSFAAMEKKNIVLATLCIVLSIYIKLFGAVALLLFLFYPNKPKFIAYTAMWFVVLFLLPLIAVPFDVLISNYREWGHILKGDESVSWGLSIMGVLKPWIGAVISKPIMQTGAAIILLIPLASTKSYKNLQFRLFYLCSILIWVVTFNHKAESPSFIIAVAGMAIWMVAQELKPIHIVLVVFAIAVTSLAHSDIFPRAFRDSYVDAYVIKGIPAFVLWVIIQTNIYLLAFKTQPLQTQDSTGVSQK
jgi:hypothetical protein